MNRSTSSSLLVSALLGCSSQVCAQLFVTLGSVAFKDPVATGGGTNPNNLVYSASVTSGFHLSSTLTQMAFGVLTRVNTNAFTSSSGFRMRSSSNPSLWADFSLTVSAFTANTAMLTTTSRSLSGPLANSPFLAAGTVLSFEAYNSTTTGATVNAAEVTGSSISVQLNSVSAPSAPVATFSFAGPFSSLEVPSSTSTGGSTVHVGTAVATSSYFVSSQTVLYSATLSNLRSTQSPFGDLLVTATNSSAPGLLLQFRPWTHSGSGDVTTGSATSYSFSGTAIGGTASGGIINALISAGSLWSFSFDDALDGPPTGTDMDLSNLSFGFTGSFPPPSALTAVATASIDSVNSLYDPDNANVLVGTVATAFNFGSTAVISATATQLISSSFATEMRIRFRSSAYPGVFADFQPFSNPFSSGTVTQARSVLGIGALIGVPLPAGSNLRGEFFESVDNGPGPDARFTSLSVSLSNNTTTVFTATTFTGSAIDLGDISDASAPESNPFMSAVTALSANAVTWFKFTTSSAITPLNERWLDVWTRTHMNADVTGSSLIDPEMALFASNGLLLGVNDDMNGSLNLLSGLSIGLPRTPTITPISNGLIADRRLPAGTYYIGVRHFEGTFSNGFLSSFSSIAVTPGIRMTFRTNLPASNQLVSGNLFLQNTLNPFASPRALSYAVKLGSSTIATGTVSASGPVTNYSISIPSVHSGAAVIEWDGASFLLRKRNVNLTGANLAGINVLLENGDSDNSGEVDAADIDAVIADFGGSGLNTDVDASGEVDAADIDIVIANFGGVND